MFGWFKRHHNEPIPERNDSFPEDPGSMILEGKLIFRRGDTAELHGIDLYGCSLNFEGPRVGLRNCRVYRSHVRLPKGTTINDVAVDTLFEGGSFEVEA